jgi:Holliday junction resolvase RusA-like endonuclease
VRACWPPRFERNVSLQVLAFWPNERRGDLDNVVKAASDALNGVAFKDDRQVVELIARVGIDSARPRLEITVEEAL